MEAGIIDGVVFQTWPQEEQDRWTLFFKGRGWDLNQIVRFKVLENNDVEIHVVHRNAEGHLHLDGHCDLGRGTLFLESQLDAEGQVVYLDCRCGRKPANLPKDETNDPYGHDTCTKPVVLER